MSHPTPLELSMYADRALAPAEQEALEAHVHACEACRAELAALERETSQLTVALEGELEIPEMPKFSRPATLRGFALANVATGLVIWLAQFLWKTLFGEAIIEAASWFSSIFLPDIYAVASGTALYLIEEGTAMLDAYLGFIVVSVVIFSIIALLMMRARTRGGAGMFAVVALIAVVALPVPSHALELRRSDGVINIPASETIDDTLMVAAEAVVIEGSVTGDVFAVGQSVDISGDVGGNIFTAAENVKVRGNVGGMIMGASRTFSIDGAVVSGDVWLAGESLVVDPMSTVQRNATMAAQSVTVEGNLGKDLYAFGESVELDGTLGRNLEVFGNRLRLMAGANVGGDLRFRGSEERLFRADGATVAGNVEFLAMPEELTPRNRYATLEFYLWQVAQLIAAFLVGWLLLSLIPGMRNLQVASGMDGLKSAGLGLAALIGIPMVAVLVAITIIGIPFAMIAFLAWGLALYLTTIVIGNAIGSMVMSGNDSVPQVLLVGLLIVFVAINVPWFGEIFDFVLTILGLGLLVQYFYKLFANRRSPAAEAA